DLGRADRGRAGVNSATEDELVRAHFQDCGRYNFLGAQPPGIVKMHLWRERFDFAAITGIIQVWQCQRNWPDILAVVINFRWRMDSRVCYFESQQGRQRLRFDWELEHGVFLGLCINPDRISRESCRDSSKVLDVFRGRVQRGD